MQYYCFIYRRWGKKVQENGSKLCLCVCVCVNRVNQVLGSDDEVRGWAQRETGLWEGRLEKEEQKHQLWMPPEWDDEAAFCCVTCWQTTWQIWVSVLSRTTILLLLHTQVCDQKRDTPWVSPSVCLLQQWRHQLFRNAGTPLCFFKHLIFTYSEFDVNVSLNRIEFVV